jgi:capsular polysaccharide transport system permease protein
MTLDVAHLRSPEAQIGVRSPRTPKLMKPNTEAADEQSNVAPFEGRNGPDGSAQRSLVTTRSEGRFSMAVDSLARLGPLFWLTVVVPTAIATLYFGFIAPDIYVSESRYVVRSPEKPQRGGLGMLLGTAGFSTASEEVRAAQGFIESRDALRAINTDQFARNAWGNESISIVSRFDPIGWSSSFEDLYEYYRRKVSASYDTETGITTLTARAFNPQDAHAINKRLLERAEKLVNDLNVRGRDDLVRYAEREFEEAKSQAAKAALELASYRNRKGVIDPERQATVQLQMISKLQDELIGARMQRLQLSRVAAQNPQIPILDVRIEGLEKAIAEQLGAIAGSDGSLSETAAEYQRLQVQREFADQQLGMSLTALQDARNEARRKVAYVERVAEPSLPDAALEPRRLRGILATFVLSLVAWGILTMLLAGVKEHRN